MNIKYKDYLNSEHWLKIRTIILKNASCIVCNNNIGLNVHHINYNNLWNEDTKDLIVLCSKHHKRVHFSTSGKFYNNQKQNYQRVLSLKKSHELRNLINNHKISENCSRCGAKPTQAYYQIWKNKSKHYIVCCPNCGTHKQKRIENLNIPAKLTKKIEKQLKNFY